MIDISTTPAAHRPDAEFGVSPEHGVYARMTRAEPAALAFLDAVGFQRQPGQHEVYLLPEEGTPHSEARDRALLGIRWLRDRGWTVTVDAAVLPRRVSASAMERANEALIELAGEVQGASDPVEVGEFLTELVDPFGGVLSPTVSVLAEASRWCAREREQRADMADLADRLRYLAHALSGIELDLTDLAERMLTTPSPPAPQPPALPAPGPAAARPPTGLTPPPAPHFRR